ncbi:MBL fold metallo-hydrolase [Streptomyces sp. NPDC002187]|uniref:MBL fold metallo-hydrolase n=1 Tax=Streptomyces sp. NPDC002187 TaxID=3364637 RepID=UPI0036C9918F
MERIVLGDVEITRIVEWQGPFGPARAIVPGAGPEVWRDHEKWLAPEHWEPGTDSFVAALQTWVLRSDGMTVLVDTGVGNGRERPHTPQFAHRQTDFLGQLATAGVRPEDVDIVVNTHVHADHVGWNTVEREGEWVPAFPNARYLIAAADHASVDPQSDHSLGRPDDHLVFADSIAPVRHAGQAVLWEDTHRIDAHLTLEPAPGHTPGSSVLRLESGTDRAVFVGDVLHSPVQILDPSCNSCFCEDERAAAATRRRLLERAADERELVIPAHFAGSGTAEVRRAGSGFAITGWA